MIHESPQRIVEHIVDTANRHAGDAVFPDDICLVAIEASSLLIRASQDPRPPSG
jgi:serine phosphatase RsbU (regulator of sigma subunit)